MFEVRVQNKLPDQIVEGKFAVVITAHARALLSDGPTSRYQDSDHVGDQ